MTVPKIRWKNGITEQKVTQIKKLRLCNAELLFCNNFDKVRQEEYSTPTGENLLIRPYYIPTTHQYGLSKNAGKLNDYGFTAKIHINQICSHFSEIQIDKYVIMPNHIHCIVKIGCSAAEERSRPFPTLSHIIGLYKSGVTREIHKRNPQLKIWQKSFHDHIIRNEKDYQKIWEYIDTNPLKWKEDCFYTNS